MGTWDAFYLLSQPAPLLHYLSLSYESGPPALVFPPKFLGGNPPNLRHIKLSTSSHIPWDSGLFANLTSLDVTGAARGGPNNPNAPQPESLLSALKSMPELEFLSLHNCLPQFTSSTTAWIHVDLQNLRQLRVTGGLRDSTRFLRQLTINNSATVGFFAAFSSCVCATTTQTLRFTWRDSHRNFQVDAWGAQQGPRSIKQPNIKLTFGLPHSLCITSAPFVPYRRKQYHWLGCSALAGFCAHDPKFTLAIRASSATVHGTLRGSTPARWA
ncbi:hypothetical protein BD779DRAFT_1581181 [Infundibulicybe gibba]|nr:hypothetical protein BD779DRAFT_1581181 [Infundibulicybe gibba]